MWYYEKLLGRDRKTHNVMMYAQPGHVGGKREALKDAKRGDAIRRKTEHQPLQIGDQQHDDGNDEFLLHVADEMAAVLDEDRQTILWPEGYPRAKQFSIRIVHRRLQLKCSMQTHWEAVCPYHSDPCDALSTRRKKAIQFSNPADKDTTLGLFKHWFWGGRACSTRKGFGGHGEIAAPSLPLLTHPQLNGTMEWAINQEAWIDSNTWPEFGSSSDDASDEAE